MAAGAGRWNTCSNCLSDYSLNGREPEGVIVIIVAGTIDFADRSARDEAIAASLALQEATRTDEPGCLAYRFAPDPGVDTRMLVYELWADETALAAHFEHDNYFRMRDTLSRSGIVAAVAEKFRCDLREPVYDDSFTPRADFVTEQER